MKFFSARQVIDGVWYGGFVLAAFAWLAAHYAIERHPPELYIIIFVAAMLAYGIWGLRRTDFKSFAKDAGEAFHEVKDGKHGDESH